MVRFQESDLAKQKQFRGFDTIRDMIRFITRPWCLSDYYLSMINICHPDLKSIGDKDIELMRQEIESWQYPFVFGIYERTTILYKDYTIVFDISEDDLIEYSIQKDGEYLLKWTK